MIMHGGGTPMQVIIVDVSLISDLYYDHYDCTFCKVILIF